MLWTIISLLLAFWLVGIFLKIGGGLIHILLVVAVAVFIYNLIVGRKR
jgi:K+-transporting ATPase A subunit